MNRLCAVAAVGVLAASSLPGVVGAASGERAASYISPRNLDVQLSDVRRVYGSDYRFLLGRSIPNRQIASPSILTGLSTAADALRGRIGGYIVEYVRKNGTILVKGKLSVVPGLGSVSGVVNAYRDRTGPTLVLRDALRYRVANGAGLSYHVAPLKGVGDAAALHSFTSVQPHGIPTAYGAIIIFRRGRYTVSLNFSSFKTMSMSRAVRLAKIIDNRIRRVR